MKIALRMRGRYSIRRPGMTAWATCETLREARTLLWQANNMESGHKIIDNRTVGRGAGRPPIGTETATHHVHIRTTAPRKSAWVRAARPKSLAEWATENLDRASKYEPTEQD